MQNWVGRLRETLALLLVVAISPAFAQGQPYPTLKGNNARTGNNGATVTANPGLANLNWFAPTSAEADRGNTTIVDNLDAGASFTSNWIAPVAGTEAPGAYWHGISEQYRYATCVKGYTDNTGLIDNTRAMNDIGLEVATFTLQPKNASGVSDTTARDFGVYIHFPDGPTKVGASTLYQMAYQVVKITPSGGPTYVDIVNVAALGKGWVRLGNGGMDTAKLFHYDGTTPITVQLYNTIPRDGTGHLLDTRDPSTLAVYADAAKVSSDLGSYTASPTVFQLSPTDGRVVSALNASGQDVLGNSTVQGVVYSRDYKTGQLQWKWSPPAVGSSGGSGALGLTVDNQDPSVSADSAFTSDTSGTAGSFLGSDYFSSTITNDVLASGAVGYSPNLDKGSYNIYFHTVKGGTFGRFVGVDITEDGGLSFDHQIIDQSQAGPWVQIGSRRYNNVNSTVGSVTTSSLQVYISNYSADPSDAGKIAYADALRFEGLPSGGITSTPVQAKVFLRQTTNSVPVLTNVVLVATEQGVLYCLDAAGNTTDKTTTVYWTYPSSTTPDPNNITASPDHSPDGSDGVTRNISPTLFNTSSALIQSTQPPVYNGGVTYGYEDWVQKAGLYYISMKDGNTGVDPATDGSHTNWAPVSDPGDSNHAQDRLFIGASNGRVYSIDMTGRGDFTSTTPGTTVRDWTYPDDYPAAVQSSNLGPFKCSLAFSAATDHTGALVGTIYACTAQGRVFALNATGDPSTRTTNLEWQYPASGVEPLGPITSTPAIAFGKLYVGTAMGNNGANPGEFICLKTDSDLGASNNWGLDAWASHFIGDSAAATDNFFGGPAIATAADLNGVLGTSMPDTVFVANQNRYVYALNAATGALLWKTNELNAGVQGALAFTCLTVPYYDTVTMSYNSTPTNGIPTVMVPTENGHVVGLYANTTLNNRIANGTRRNYEFDMTGGTVSGIACGYDWMYSVDQAGYLYAFNTLAGAFGSETPPGTPVVIENNPQYDRYATGKVRLITEAGYQALRSGSGNYTNLDSGSYDASLATYEYGETIYAVVYNYPNDVLASDGTTAMSITANFNMSVEGATLSSVSSNSQTIAGAPFSAGVSHDLDGLSLLTFALDEAGSFSLPPGHGVMQVTLQSAYNTTSQPYSLSNQEGQGQRSFTVANPLAIYIDSSNQIGNSTDRTTAENVINGNGPKQIDASAGAVAHGQSGLSDISVIDRSLMTLKRGPGLGLNQIRIQRGDLNWKYSGSPTSSIVNPLPSWAASFEDLPVNIPNTSKDYPDIRRDRVTATKDPNGSPQNPLFNGVELTPPPTVDDSTISAANGRALQNTPFRLAVEVPKYQPANYSGYKGPMIVFVDSTQTGTFDITSTKRSAYRTLNLGTVVTADKRLKLGQSVIDLKSLSGGAGMSSSAIPAPYDPNTSGMYQAMDVYNMGNVNLLNVRLAHGTSGRPGGDGTAFGSSTADGNAWLDSHVHLLSDLDPNIWDPAVNTALGISSAKPFAVKPRVGDRQPAKMSVNPRSRVNPSTALFSNANWPAGASPQVTMRIPLGFPAGSYQHSIRVIEDDASADALLDFSGSAPSEAFSDPTAILKFKVAETRLTNGQSLYNLPAIDSAIPATAPNAFKNKQPTGMRTPVGDLVVAWISDRSTPVNPSDTSYSDSTPTFTPSPAYPGATILNPKDRLYVAGIQGSASTVAAASYNNSLSFSSPLSDLTNFVSGSQWFNYRSGANPFPKDDNEAKDLLLPDGLPTSTNIDFQMHHPSLPTLGEVSPVDGSTFSKAWLAVVGDARFQLASGNQTVSRIILAPVTTSSGVPTLDETHAGYIDGDDAAPKGKPSVVQLTNDNVIVFYASGSGGQSHLNYATVNTSAGYVSGTHKFAVSASTPIDVPAGFELAGSPSVVYRNNAYYEIAFVGKLSGRPNAEVFMVRLPVDTVHGNIPNSANGLALFPLRVGEQLLNEGGGTFRAKGVGWDLATGFALVDGATGATLIDSASRTIDPNSGVVTYKSSRLGGQVYLNTHDGTVRFTSNAPLQKMDVRLSYRPTVVRLSDPASAGHAGVSLVYDDHQVTSGLYWVDISSNSALPVSPAPSITASRFVATYNRAASGAGQAARPYWKTLRQGVQLSHSIYINPATGLAAGISIAPVSPSTLSGFYQYDPVKGRIYFADNAGSLAQEGMTVDVTYTALDQTTGQPLGSSLVERVTIGLIDEQDEAAIPIDVPVNENGLATFFDPMSFSSRPSLYWMIWSSARGNGADVFMQTVSPNFVPTVGQ